MDYSNEQIKARAIIIDRYENPINKNVNDIKDIKEYLCFNNRSESCIDNITIYLKIVNNKVLDAKFDGIGCAISTSSTDIFCSLIMDKTIIEVKKILNEYFKMINSEKYNEKIILDLNIFSNINKQPNRIKCALIAYGAIKKILEGINND